MTASTGLILALNQVGVFSRESTSASPTPTTAVVLSASQSAKPATAPGTEVSTAAGVDELEQRLKAANIMLSTGGADEREKVRGYFDASEAPYRLLAISCIQVMGNQRLKKTGYLDMIDKHFSAMGDESLYVPVDGKLNLEKVKQAMVKAQREYHGDLARIFEEIVELR
jgi:hypothetical protein